MSRFGSTLRSLVSLGDVILGIDVPARPFWYSADGGDSWQRPTSEPTFTFYVTGTSIIGGRIVVVGTACCTLPGARVGVALTSNDGLDWTATEPAILPSALEGVVAVPGGLVALGAVTYLSDDGVDWRQGPELPGYGEQGQLIASSQEDQLIVIAEDRAWMADLNDLDLARWTQSVAPSQRPAVGDAFAYELVTHCGLEGATIRFDLRAWVPDPSSLVDGDWPSSFEDPVEAGTLDFVAEDVLLFTGSAGEVVRYLPAETPPPSFPCA